MNTVITAWSAAAATISGAARIGSAVARAARQRGWERVRGVAGTGPPAPGCRGAARSDVVVVTILTVQGVAAGETQGPLP